MDMNIELQHGPVSDDDLVAWIKSLPDGKPEVCIYLCPFCPRAYRKAKVLDRHQHRHH